MKPPDKCVVDITIPTFGRGVAASVPHFIHVGHRHFQKELPTALSGGTSCNNGLYRLPVDYLRMVIPVGSSVTDGIEEVLLGYKKG